MAAQTVMGEVRDVQPIDFPIVHWQLNQDWACEPMSRLFEEKDDVHYTLS